MHLKRASVRGAIGVMLGASLAGATLVDDFDVTALTSVASRVPAEQAALIVSAYLTQSGAAFGVDSRPDVVSVTAVPAGRADLAEPALAPMPDAHQLRQLKGRTWWVVRAGGVFVLPPAPNATEPMIARTGYLIVDSQTGETWGMGTP